MLWFNIFLSVSFSWHFRKCRTGRIHRRRPDNQSTIDTSLGAFSVAFRSRFGSDFTNDKHERLPKWQRGGRLPSGQVRRSRTWKSFPTGNYQFLKSGLKTFSPYLGDNPKNGNKKFSRIGYKRKDTSHLNRDLFFLLLLFFDIKQQVPGCCLCTENIQYRHLFVFAIVLLSNVLCVCVSI